MLIKYLEDILEVKVCLRFNEKLLLKVLILIELLKLRVYNVLILGLCVFSLVFAM